jgi:outer membrane protein OmpA-like peptidoglycan-associated protein
MKKFLMISVLCGLAGCASLPFGGPRAASTPATPVFFQPFSAALDAPALTTIASVAQEAKEKPGTRVTVTGAADSVGSSKANKDLSQTRAQVVADALVSDGVAPGRIHTRAIGIAPSHAAYGTPAQYARRALIQVGN